jgi:hypothetical protein
MLKKLCQCIGLSSLILVVNYGDLLGGGADVRMHTPFPLARICYAQIADILVVALLSSSSSLAAARASIPGCAWSPPSSSRPISSSAPSRSSPSISSKAWCSSSWSSGPPCCCSCCCASASGIAASCASAAIRGIAHRLRRMQHRPTALGRHLEARAQPDRRRLGDHPPTPAPIPCWSGSSSTSSPTTRSSSTAPATSTCPTSTPSAPRAPSSPTPSPPATTPSRSSPRCSPARSSTASATTSTTASGCATKTIKNGRPSTAPDRLRRRRQGRMAHRRRRLVQPLLRHLQPTPSRTASGPTTTCSTA